jgi:hypothetical protein
MPSTYTLNNGIELIGTGEQSGTWGSTTNTNLELLDTALDGQVTVTLSSTGSSGSPNALPISDGSNSDGRNRLITFNDGSDLGGTAYVQLTPNDAEKIIYVRNSLSGSRSILLFQGTYNASNDYEVPAGTTAVVFFNGAGTGAVAANVFNNAFFDSLRLGGVSVTAILDEDDMSSDSATALATQQSIKKYVDDKAAAQDTLAEVLANGNTTGGTDIVVSVDDVISLDNGTNALPSLTTTGDLNTGLYFPAADEVGLTVGGTQRLNVSATGVDVTGALEVTTTALVTGVLTTTAATAFNGGFATAAEGLAYFDLGAYSATASNNAGFRIRSSASAAAGEWAGMTFQATTGDSSGTYWQQGIVSGAGSYASDFVIKSSTGASSMAERLKINSVGGLITTPAAGGHAVFNESGANSDFSVESVNNSNMLFVDAADNRVGIGTGAGMGSTLSVVGSAGTGGALATFGSGNDSALLAIGTSNSNGAGGSQTWSNGANYAHAITFGNVNNGRVQSRTAASIYTSDVTTYGRGNLNFATKGTSDDADPVRRMSILVAGGFRYYNPAGNGTVWNEDGVDADFRVESDSNTHMLFVDAGTNSVKINSNSTTYDGGAPFQIGYNTTTTYGPNIQTDNRTYVHFTGAGGGSANNSYIHGYQIGNPASGSYLRVAPGLSNNIVSGVQQGQDGLLYVYNSGKATGDADYTPTISHRIDFGTGGSVVFNEPSADIDFRVESDSKTHILFVNAGTNRIGMGTNDPTGSLHLKDVTDNGGADVYYVAQNTANNRPAGYKVLDESGNRVWQGYYDNGGNRGGIFIEPPGLGNADIGFDGTTFEISSNSSSAKLQLQSGSTDRLTFYAINSAVFNEPGEDYDFRVESDSNANMLLVDAGTNQVRVGTGSNVTFGDSRLQVLGPSSGWNIGLDVAATTNSSGAIGVAVASGSSARVLRVDKVGIGIVGTIDQSDTGVTYNTTSDRRLKDNIEPIADATDKLMSMKPVTHTWIAAPEADAVHGFIAQEMQEIVPEAVSGEDGGEEMMSMDYGRITPVLVAALQDAHNKITALEKRLAELEAN